jgi:signal transduction histidine kinase
MARSWRAVSAVSRPRTKNNFPYSQLRDWCSVAFAQPAPRIRRWLLALVGVSVVVTLASVVRPAQVESVGARVTIETTITIFAVTAAWLAALRFRHTRELRDLLLATTLVIVSTADFPSTALPAMAGIAHAGLAPELRSVARLVVAVGFLATALAPAGRGISSRIRPLVFVTVAAVTAITVFDVLPMLEHDRGALVQAAVVTSEITSAALMLIAGAAFLFRDPLARQETALLAGGAFLLAIARLETLNAPGGADWITPATGARLAAYGLLLAAAVKQLARTRRAAAQAEVLAERLRIARDLHDGLAQDLAFIASYSDRLASDLGAEHPLTIAAKRALAVSRGTIVDLTASSAPTTAAALKHVAEELEWRHGVDIDVHADDLETELDPADRSELVRIAREAIVNAVHHGRAQHINVRLGSPASGALLSVVDDGCGLDASDPLETRGTGLGMRAMRSSAKTLGGDLVASPAPGGGTLLEVVV